jgi:hypothetical protein
LSSSSRPPLGTVPHRSKPGSGLSTLQTPWGTAADVPPRIGGYGVATPIRNIEAGPVAGMPSAGAQRSASVPSRGYGQASAALGSGVPGDAPRGLGGNSTNSSKRFTSPLSHAGHRMLAL